MIAGMTPLLQAGTFVFCSSDEAGVIAKALPVALSSFREDEGLSLILPIANARELGFEITQPMRCITLMVYSALDGVGLTAAVAGALARHGIPCNMVAAYHHDHAFVPADQAEEAMGRLVELQEGAAP